MSKVYIKSFGCQMNEYDSDRLADALKESNSLERTSSPKGATVIMLNTCSIRKKAQEKLFDELGRLRKFKEADPSVRIGVGGCVASQEGRNILKRAPYVDLIFGPQTIHRTPEMLDLRETSGEPQVDISFPTIEKFDELFIAGITGPRAYVSIMEGCSKYCSFCVVPYTRGQEVSRPVADCLEEIANLALRGVREVTLLGQNVNAYLGLEPSGATASLARLIECIAQLDGIERIRYTTSHPVNFTDDLINAHGEIPELMPHVHLPVQSGDDRVLSRMKRGHTLLEYKQIIRKLRKVNPNITITSDFIVGFPEESEEQFQRTVDLVNWVQYDGGYSFSYSPRPGTPAASYGNQIPPKLQQERLEKLQTAINERAREQAMLNIGTTQQVLVEGPAKKGDMIKGRIPNNRVVIFKAKAKAGELCDVFIESLQGTTLMGKTID